VSGKPGWDAPSAIEACPITSLKQAVWRGHRSKYDALDASGSRLVSARYHIAPPDASSGRSWPALYTALDLAVALAEVQRNIQISALKDYRFTEIWVRLEAVFDFRDLYSLGLTADQLLDDHDYTLAQSIALAALDAGAEAILVPSASRLGDNLILFPDQIRSASVIQEVRFIDPHLVKRTAK
jgi:RES domain-containing protein